MFRIQKTKYVWFTPSQYFSLLFSSGQTFLPPLLRLINQNIVIDTYSCLSLAWILQIAEYISHEFDPKEKNKNHFTSIFCPCSAITIAARPKQCWIWDAVICQSQYFLLMLVLSPQMPREDHHIFLLSLRMCRSWQLFVAEFYGKGL